LGHASELLPSRRAAVEDEPELRVDEKEKQWNSA
jgi:hypothetical protein